MAVGAVAALSCVSAIGAATTLVVLAANDSQLAPVVPHDRECAVVAWKSGSIHCFRNIAQADPAR